LRSNKIFMAIKIFRAGILDTIQDKGRYGYQHLGINPGGAMDQYAMQVANILVGNDPGEAVIELHFPASVFLFDEPALIALSGADFSASINGEPVPVLHAIQVNKNDVLQFHRPLSGARTYISFRGGLDLPQWLNSASTNLKAQGGGFNGRVLQKGDELFLRDNKIPIAGSKEGTVIVLPWSADINTGDETTDIAVLPGHEWERLTGEAKQVFTGKPFIITKQSDRMGYRLLNEPLSCTHNPEMISSAVCFGTIQLLPDGKLIVLMADHQTTGGYPRIGHVITAHHSRLAQLNPGAAIRFRLTDSVSAENLFLKQQQHLLQLQNACTFRLEAWFKK
jgi:antagonist of KipI